MKTIIAATIAPVLPAVVVIILFGLDGNRSYNILAAALILTMSFMGSYLIGLPIYYWLRNSNKLSASRLLLFGTIAGAIVFSIFRLFFGYTMGPNMFFYAKTVMLGALYGFSVAIIFVSISGMKWNTYK